MDFVAGNLGLNSKLKPYPGKPLRLYVADFDQNGQTEQLLTYTLKGREVVFATYSEVTQQLPGVRKKFLFAKDFADASPEDLVGKQPLANALRLEVLVTESSWFENKGDDVFDRHALPRRLQFAPLRAGLVRDVDLDGIDDLIVMGNFYEANVEMGRYDADFGNILFGVSSDLGDTQVQTLHITGQVRNLRSINTKNGELIIIAKNDAPVQVIRIYQDHTDL
jgi:hypothetical protein